MNSSYQPEPAERYGLPKEFDNFWVHPDYRTNPLSRVKKSRPEDYDLVIETTNIFTSLVPGHSEFFGYDKIAYPDRYIRKMFENFLTERTDFSWEDFLSISPLEQQLLLKRVFVRIFLGVYNPARTEANFTEVWNTKGSDVFPWSHLLIRKTRKKIAKNRQSNSEVWYPQSTMEAHYGYDFPEWAEDPVDKAARIFDIPDPNLLEDFF
ncbi:MAG: hypothetical protein F6K30_00380 [Cyanothece sp. SIO2G6]|nr:hypothetical protein [Cyanothece sp. SIO2G6]